MIKLIAIALTVMSLGVNAYEKEDYYNKQYCSEMGGTFGQYHKNTGATRAFVDCETDDTVWEGEWSHKSYRLWDNPFGMLDGIIFYIKKDNQQKYIDRAVLTMDSLNIEYKIKVVNLTTKEK